MELTVVGFQYTPPAQKSSSEEQIAIRHFLHRQALVHECYFVERHVEYWLYEISEMLDLGLAKMTVHEFVLFFVSFLRVLRAAQVYAWIF